MSGTRHTFKYAPPTKDDKAKVFYDAYPTHISITSSITKTGKKTEKVSLKGYYINKDNEQKNLNMFLNMQESVYKEAMKNGDQDTLNRNYHYWKDKLTTKEETTEKSEKRAIEVETHNILKETDQDYKKGLDSIKKQCKAMVKQYKKEHGVKVVTRSNKSASGFTCGRPKDNKEPCQRPVKVEGAPCSSHTPKLNSGLKPIETTKRPKVTLGTLLKPALSRTGPSKQSPKKMDSEDEDAYGSDEDQSDIELDSSSEDRMPVQQVARVVKKAPLGAPLKQSSKQSSTRSKIQYESDEELGSD